jgi:hypothetical protein
MLFVQKKLACSAQILFEKPLKNCMFTRAKSAKRDEYLVTKIHHVFSDSITVKNVKFQIHF